MNRRALSLVLAGLVAAGACVGSEPELDIVLRGGTVVDGSGLPRFEADVGVKDGRIARMGDLSGVEATEEVDVTGLHVVPGFVNLHSHGRLEGLPTAGNLLLQGVTTVVLNADGGGPVDLGEQLAEAEAVGPAVNVGANIGFNRVWSEVVGPDDRRPTPEETARTREMLEAGLRAGAWGVSAGLDYKPAYYATTEEVVGVLEGLGAWRTVFTNHDRLTPETGYSSRVGMRETIEIGERTGLVPLITHMKVQGREQGSADAVLAMMEDATSRGVHTAADAYPYLAGQTSLAALIIPGWAQEGGREAMLARFTDPAQRRRIVAEADEALAARFDGPGGVFLPETQRELTDVMAEMSVESGGEAVVRLLEEEGRGAILRFGSEPDLIAILRHPTTSVACDCDATSGRVSHPRAYGTFPRVLGRYVREQRALTWEEAIRKMTGLPAVTIGMVDRGFVAPGMAADLAVIDPETVIDHSTYADPAAPPEGVVHVLVNGSWALRDGDVTGQRAGRVLRRDRTMPARRMDTADRSLSVAGPVEVGGAAGSVSVSAAVEVEGSVGAVSVDIALAQSARAARAEGTLTIDTGEARLTATELGRLQTQGDWASVTAWTVSERGERDAVTVVVDGADPVAGARDGARIRISIGDAPAIEGRLGATPDIGSGVGEPP